MAAHSSTLAWKLSWMEEPDSLPSMGSHRIEHDWSDLAAVAAVYLTVYNWHSHLKIDLINSSWHNLEQ